MGNSILALDTGGADIARAVRLRDALDPLLIEDALVHSTAADIACMRIALEDMRVAIDDRDPTSFTRANWGLHAALARVSPDTVTKLCLNLLEFVESQTMSVQGSAEQPLSDYIGERYRLHVELVDALDNRDHSTAMSLIAEHRTTGKWRCAAVGHRKCVRSFTGDGVCALWPTGMSVGLPTERRRSTNSYVSDSKLEKDYAAIDLQ